MIYAKTEVGGTAEFLASKDFTAIPFKAAVAQNASSTKIKAGTPLASNGQAAAIANGAVNAVGILLYDVDVAKNPNCAIVVQGVVDLAKVKTASGLSTLTAAMLQTALPGIVARADIGVNS